MGDWSATDSYLLEQQVWNVCAFAGMVALALGAAGLFATFCLVALGLSTDIDALGTFGTIAVVLATLIVSKVVVARLWLHAKVTFISIASWFAPFLPALTDVDPDGVEELRRRTDLKALFSFGFITTPLFVFFLEARWSCTTARPTGGPTNGICVWFGDSMFGEVVLAVLKISYAGFGVGATLLGIVILLELQAAWRDSILQRWLHSTSIPFWWNPMADLKQSESDDK